MFVIRNTKISKLFIAASAIFLLVITSGVLVLSAKNNPSEATALDATQTEVRSEATESTELREPTEMNVEDPKAIIDKNLEIIMSSIKATTQAASVNLTASINKHKAEYKQIILLGEEALPDLYSVFEEEKGIKGELALAAMLEIKPDLNIKRAESTAKHNYSYRIETYGIDFGNQVSGMYPAKEIRLVDTNTDKTLWSMTPGYLKTDFSWSPDGRYVAISYMAREYAETIVLDTNTMTLVSIPGMEELSKQVDKVLAPRENRPDPHFWAYKWTYSSTLKLKMTFDWTAQNDNQVEGGFIYDLAQQKIEAVFADYKETLSPLELESPIKLEIKYNYFNYFEEGYKPFEITDSKIIHLIVTSLENSTIIHSFEYEDIDRVPNPIAEMTFFYNGREKAIRYIIDTLYNKAAFEMEGVYYSTDYDTARLIQNLEKFRPKSIEVDQDVKALLSGYGLNPVFYFTTTDVELPDTLLYKGDEFPTKLYWSYNLQLSKDIGLDFSRYLGKTLTAEQYYLLNPLPDAYFPERDAYAVILRDNGEIVGAYIHAAGHLSYACSLFQSSFEEITGLSFQQWFAKNGYDQNDPINIKNAKLSPEEVVRLYFEALNRGDESYMQYEAIRTLKRYPGLKKDLGKLLSSSWYEDVPDGMERNIESIKLLSLEESQEPTEENEKIFDIAFDLKVKKVITNDSGIDTAKIWLVQEGAMGWKVVAYGH